MRKPKTLTLITAALVAAGGLAIAAGGGYNVISAREPGRVAPTGIGVGRVVSMVVEDAIPNNGTVTISRISPDGSSTNQLLSATASSGAAQLDIAAGTNLWIMAGDKLLRGGSVTNDCRVTIIIAEGP